MKIGKLLDIFEINLEQASNYDPVNTGRKLNVQTSWTSSECLMYVQFTSFVYGGPSEFDQNVFIDIAFLQI